ncbi:hypothetical protein [Streptomyces sp. NBC_01443]|uniref:hypothetical protein n=1 Tax=Streptomyces sp. NBC_01443 TaxID=2903868 RepID=UPI002B1CD0B2|nr:hypothetical protein [Streptomyces sp. NBC_01443]
MDREADVTVSDSDRLHSQLSRFEDMFPGYRMEIVEGAIVVSPLKPHLVETGIGKISVDTSALPVDPGTTAP